MAAALTTQGVTLARLNRPENSIACFKRSIDVAQEVGALSRAGIAALAMLEELEELPREELQTAFLRAHQWLRNSDSKPLLMRLVEAAASVVSRLGGSLSPEAAMKIVPVKSSDMQQTILKHEGSLIKEALLQVNGSVTHAASLLGLSHQGLAYVIQTRHKELLKDRSPIHRRPRRNKAVGEDHPETSATRTGKRKRT
jgi:hypothetical protein